MAIARTQQQQNDIEQIARTHLGLETLEPQRSGADFREQAVWTITSALNAAYEAGQNANAIAVVDERDAKADALAEMVAAFGTGSYGTARQAKALAKAKKALGA